MFLHELFLSNICLAMSTLGVTYIFEWKNGEMYIGRILSCYLNLRMLGKC